MLPSVSVVIPVHNCMPHLEDTLASVYHQSLPREDVEVVAVDDGSSDGSSECLARWADRWPQLKVLTQEASGGPSRPRNVGIDQASGEYLFFLDGDDCLGLEALERLLAAARRNDSDVVLGKLVGVQRQVPTRVFQKDVARADLTSGIYYSLMPFKLVRRSLVVERGIRFPEHMRISEDQLFTASCYLAASVISIVGSYDCYYLVRRHDGSNTSFEGLDYATIVRQADEIVQMILRETSPGPLQVHLVARHVRVELLRRFNYHFGAKPAEEQQSMVDIAQPYAAAWDVPGLLLELSVPERLLLLAVRSGDGPRTAEVVAWTLRGNRAPVVADEGRWLLAGPGFGTEHDDDVFALKAAPSPTVRIEQLSLAAGVLTVVGSAHFRGIDSTCSEVSLVARHADSGRELAATTSRLPSPHVNAMDGGGGVSYADAGFRATFALDDDDLAQGEWRLAVCLRAGDLAEERPVRRLEGFRKSSWKSPQHVAVLRAEQGNVVLAVRRKGSATQPTDTGLTQRLRTRLRRSN